MAKLKWKKQAQYGAAIVRGQVILALVVTRNRKTDDWLAVAISSPKSGLAVFDDHAHDVIGSFRSLAAAKRACESYAAIRKSRKVPRCGCSEITA